MAKSIFVSCAENEAHWLKKIHKWNEKGKMGRDVVISHEAEQDFHDYNIIKAHIKEILHDNEVDMIVVLQGDSPHNDDWIQAEVELSSEVPTKLFCMRLPGTEYPKPEGLGHIKEISFNPNTIVRFLYGKEEKPYRRYRPRKPEEEGHRQPEGEPSRED